MAFNSLTAVTIILGFAVGLLNGQGFKPAGQISEHCFNCLCEASSGCDEGRGCKRDSAGINSCGPYLINKQYWKEGGSPGENPNNPLDFEKCVSSKPCAEAAIRGYMQQHGKDCNGDRMVDCYDWALLHRAGPAGCSNPSVQKTDFWRNFSTCYEQKRKD